MSNALPVDVTRYMGVQRVAASASASASASAFLSPARKETMLEPVPSRADWDYALTERIGIMEDSGILSNRASALALADTIKNHGHRPEVSA